MSHNPISAAQAAYLTSCRFRQRRIRLYRILILIVFLVLWESGARLGWIDDFIFSSPSKLFACFSRMTAEHALFFHIGVTLFETLASFFLVMAGSVLVTILLWYSKSLTDTLDPYLVVLNSLPKSALAPLLIVWLGANYNTVIITGISVAVFGSILSLYTSFQSVDPEKIKLIKTLGGKKHHILTKVVLPANIPALFAVMKVNIGLCLVGVIIGEFISSRQGLGYLIIYGSQVFGHFYILLL